MNPTLTREAAIAAVTAAAGVCRAVQADIGAALDKSDRSPVTVADYAAQAIIGELLRRALPDIPLVGEEDASALRDPANRALAQRVVTRARAVLPELDHAAVLAAIDRGVARGGATGRHWVLDPIDGTKGFLRGAQYAVALALVSNGEPVLGVLGCPNLPRDLDAADGPRGSLLVAERGGGTIERALDGGPDRPAAVAQLQALADARFCESVEKAHSDQSAAGRVAAALGIVAPPVRVDSQCKYALVARGDAAVYLRLPARADYVEKVWDHAAGALVVTEAGGRVTDVDGRPLDFSLGRLLERNRGVVATSGPFHTAVLAAVADEIAAPGSSHRHG